MSIKKYELKNKFMLIFLYCLKNLMTISLIQITIIIIKKNILVGRSQRWSILIVILPHEFKSLLYLP